MPTPARKPAPGQRQTAFAACVQRAVRLAKNRGMTVVQIEEATGVGNSTFYAWQKGEWTKDPRPTQVRSFFEGLGMDVTEAYQALGWAAPDKDRKGAEPVISDPDVQELFDLANRKLNDPNVPALEKALIRREVRKTISAMKETLDL